MDRREALKMSVLASIGLAVAGKANACPMPGGRSPESLLRWALNRG